MNGQHSDNESAGARSAAPGDATMQLSPGQGGTQRLKIPHAMEPGPPPKPKRSGRRMRLPFRGSEIWWWLLGGLGLLLIMTLASYFFLRPRPQGFTLRVGSSNAAPVNDVVVEGVHRGIPGTDGTLRVPYLALGKQKVRFADGTEAPDVTGESHGQTVALNVAGTVAKKLPDEIEYGGTRMRLIEGGPFTLGSSEPGALPNEGPPHQVQLEDFYIDVNEVTNALYKSYCAASGRPLPKNGFDTNYLSQDQSPVVGISFDEADAYARSVNKRLPTEAEWEKAAAWDPAQQKKRKWPWGDGPAPGEVNLGRSQPQFAAVGSSPGDRSALGLMDMAGNAYEWVNAIYAAYPGSTATDPLFGKGFRVIRGADCVHSLDAARTTAREVEPRARKFNDKTFWLIGFRCVVPVSNPQLQSYLRQRGLIQN
ncbi:MAG: SUMF1/EgtB/PvdO family nonheme iron enzyme [Blastocatellia bacterium]